MTSVREVGGQIILTAAFGSLMGSGVVWGVNTLTRYKPKYNGPLAAAGICAGVSTLSKVSIQQLKVGEKLKNQFGDNIQFEQICFMISTPLLTGVLLYKVAPRYLKRDVTFLEASSQTCVQLSAAIMAYLFSDESC